MISIELRVLIECIKSTTFDNYQGLLLLVNNNDLNWERIRNLTIYHRIRPIVYHAFNKIKVFNNVIQEFSVFCENQKMSHVINSVELYKILELFKASNIPLLPYKGLLFQEKFYSSRVLRESSDIDLVLAPAYVIDGLKLLLTLGYSNRYGDLSEASAQVLIQESQGRQITLTKMLKSGVIVTIDFHWGVNEDYHLYNIDTRDFFSSSKDQHFLNSSFLLPSEIGVLIMILNHNGGRECWTRLKDIVDLYFFLENCKEEYINLEEKASELKMKNIFISGQTIVDSILKEKGDVVYDYNIKKVVSRVVEFWEIGSRDMIKAKIRFVELYRVLQDDKYSYIKIWSIFFLHIKRKYLKTRIYGYPFKGRFTFVNFLTRLLRRFN